MAFRARKVFRTLEKRAPTAQHGQQRHNTSFHCVVERTITAVECNKIEKCTCKACKNAVFHFQICKFVRFLLSSSSCLLKLPIIPQERVHLKSKQMSSFCGNAKVEE